MRTKEVEEAINRLTKAQNNIWEATLYSQEQQDEDIKTVLNYVKELENNSISKDTLRKIKANTDTYRDFTEEVIKLL